MLVTQQQRLEIQLHQVVAMEVLLILGAHPLMGLLQRFHWQLQLPLHHPQD